MKSVGPTSAESSQFPQRGQHKLDIQGLTERGSEVGSGDLPTLSAPIPVPPAPGPQEVAGKGRMQVAPCLGRQRPLRVSSLLLMYADLAPAGLTWLAWHQQTQLCAPLLPQGWGSCMRFSAAM